MKKAIIIFAVLLAAVGAHAQINVATTNYFTNATFVASGGNWSNSFSGVGLVFDVAELNALTDAQSSNDVRAVIFNLLALYYDRIQAQASTNRPVNQVVYENVTEDAADVGDLVTTHQVLTKQTVNTFTIPAE